MRKAFIPVAALAIIGFAAGAAQARDRLNVPRAEWLPSSEIVSKLTAQGYLVTEIEVDDGAYEFEAVRDGVKLEGHAHPVTGEILHGYDND